MGRCQYCDRDISNAYNLLRHQQDFHLKELPEGCEQCDRRFVNKEQKVRHMRQAHKLSCDYPGCQMKFPSEERLVAHQREHDGGQSSKRAAGARASRDDAGPSQQQHNSSARRARLSSTTGSSASPLTPVPTAGGFLNKPELGSGAASALRGPQEVSHLADAARLLMEMTQHTTTSTFLATTATPTNSGARRSPVAAIPALTSASAASAAAASTDLLASSLKREAEDAVSDAFANFHGDEDDVSADSHKSKAGKSGPQIPVLPSPLSGLDININNNNVNNNNSMIGSFISDKAFLDGSLVTGISSSSSDTSSIDDLLADGDGWLMVNLSELDFLNVDYSHVDPSFFRCNHPGCDMEFSNYLDRDTHLSTHRNFCKYCAAVFATDEIALDHVCAASTHST